ncbi:hypothetical protein [Archangium sp.]|uniref:hypothetical protein n=1 Tax=Archangium sp. TaxID=1872627 RepID=UPI002D737DD5|nr:hypothetical protein [Archangium sp.]HYO59268.1 hypothetical protein [Archangium sp.]
MSSIGSIGFKSIINLGKSALSSATQSLSSATQSLKNVAGDFLKSGFEAAKKSLLNEIAQKLGLPAPSQALAAKSPSVAAMGAAGGSLADTVGDATGAAAAGGGAKSEMDKLLANIKDPEQKAQFKLQQEMQRQNMLFTMMTNLQQIQHDTRKAAINNLRV